MGRNLIDPYKYWRTEAIKTNLDKNRNDFSVLCCNIEGDFNIGTVIRNSNAFLAKNVYIYGNKRYDKRGTVGTHHYENIEHVSFTDDLDKVFKDHNVIGIDNVEGAEPISNLWYLNREPEIYGHPLFIFGEENSGIPPEILKKCNHVLYIPQYGSVRSLNVGCASAIVMYEYVKDL